MAPPLSRLTTRWCTLSTSDICSGLNSSALGSYVKAAVSHQYVRALSATHTYRSFPLADGGSSVQTRTAPLPEAETQSHCSKRGISDKTSSNIHYSHNESGPRWSARQSKPEVTTLSREGLALKKRLALPNEDPVTILKSQLAEGDAPVEVARICLEAYHDRLFKYPRTVRQFKVAEEKVGGLTLDWLWSQDMRWAAAVQDDVYFMEKLCYFLVAEGLEEYILGWMRQELPAHVKSQIGNGSSHQWRGRMFRAFVSAHLTLDTSNSADSALDGYFSVVGEVQAVRLRDATQHTISPFASTSFWPAQIAISKELGTGRCWNTNPRKWDRFVHWVKDRKGAKNKVSNEIGIARMSNWHPSRPNAASALAILRQQWRTESIIQTKSSLPQSSSGRALTMLFFARTSKVLRNSGRSEDADWVQGYLKELFSEQDMLDLQRRVRQDLLPNDKWEVPSSDATASSAPGPPTT